MTLECTQNIDFVITNIVLNVKNDLEILNLVEKAGWDPSMCVGNNARLMEYVDEIIKNIVLHVFRDLDSVKQTKSHSRNYILHHTDITDFISTDYWDYLTSIDDNTWTTHRTAILREFYHLKITDLKIFDLFVTKLGISQHTLFQIVKLRQPNSSIAMCCMKRYENQFIKSFTSYYDSKFFTDTILYRNLPFNKYVYHNVYCKLKLKLCKCPYKNVFSNDYPYICTQEVGDHDVFEYFIDLFGIDLKGKYENTKFLIKHVISLCCNSVGRLLDESRPSANPCTMLKRMIELTNKSVKSVRISIKEQMQEHYRSTSPYVIKHNVRKWNPWEIVSTFVSHNKIDELIEIFNHTGVDLKNTDSQTIMLLMIDVLFSNNEEIVVKFIKYLKYDVGFVMDTKFYTRLIDMFMMKNNKYVYLSFEGAQINLNKNIMDGLAKMKYTGSKITIKY